MDPASTDSKTDLHTYPHRKQKLTFHYFWGTGFHELQSTNRERRKRIEEHRNLRLPSMTL